MLQDETRSSQAVASLSASEITSIRAGLQEMIEAAEAELQRKEASAKSGQQMAQIAYTGMQSELADAREQISKLQIERGTLEIKLNDVARDLGEYREKLKQAQSDVKASVFDQVNTAVAEQTSAAISTEVARQMRNYMRSQQEQAD
jgi:predicted RNase H-like nuclease (RuvC/YqgF family)